MNVFRYLSVRVGYPNKKKSSMQIIINVIDNKDQRYPTIGDWNLSTDKSALYIYVSHLGNWKYESLIAIHETIEALLCFEHGITGEVVDEFDKQYEAKRVKNDESEPGDDPHAPYRKEHFFATNIERLLAAELGVDWQKYEEAISKL